MRLLVILRISNFGHMWSLLILAILFQFRLFGLLIRKDFFFFFFSAFQSLILSVPDEGYSRNVLCSLYNLIKRRSWIAPPPFLKCRTLKKKGGVIQDLYLVLVDYQLPRISVVSVSNHTAIFLFEIFCS